MYGGFEGRLEITIAAIDVQDSRSATRNGWILAELVNLRHMGGLDLEMAGKAGVSGAGMVRRSGWMGLVGVDPELDEAALG